MASQPARLETGFETQTTPSAAREVNNVINKHLSQEKALNFTSTDCGEVGRWWAEKPYQVLYNHGLL